MIYAGVALTLLGEPIERKLQLTVLTLLTNAHLPETGLVL